MKKLLTLLTGLGLTFGLAVFPLTGTTLIINSFRFASGPTIDHVADANARLSLTAEGVVVSGGTVVDGLYIQRGTLNGKAIYGPVNATVLLPSEMPGTMPCVYWSGSVWRVNLTAGPYSHSGEDVEFPWQVDDWSDPGHGDPAPTVTHSPGQVTGAGYQVIQDDDGLTYTFNGDGADADAGLLVKDAGTTGDNGAWILDGDRYDLIANPTIRCDSGPTWQINSEYLISIPDTYPWSQSWITTGGIPPAPTVLRNPIASEASWSHP